MKKVYFACSIRGGRNDADTYGQLVTILKKHAEVLTEIFTDNKLTSQGSPGKVEDIWEQDLKWVKEADVIIAEVTNPSLGVGYEIAKAEEWDKPILCLYRPQKDRSLSAMIAGSPKTTICEYDNIEAAEQAIKNFLSN